MAIPIGQTARNSFGLRFLLVQMCKDNGAFLMVPFSSCLLSSIIFSLSWKLKLASSSHFAKIRGYKEEIVRGCAMK